jgi:hypothetical protein
MAIIVCVARIVKGTITSKILSLTESNMIPNLKTKSNVNA